MWKILAVMLAAFPAAAGPANQLAGVTVGSRLPQQGWDRENSNPDQAGRKTSFQGYPAMQIVQTKNGLVSDVSLAFIVAHPVTGGVSSAQTGLTSSRTPKETADKIAAAIRQAYIGEGFKPAPGINPQNPSVQHYCAPGKRERTIGVIQKTSSVYFVMTAIPPYTNCP